MISDLLGDPVEREFARRSLYEFAKQAWPIVYREPMIDNWHMKEMADAIEKAILTPGSRTIINVFPRSGKSSLISVLLTPWMWLRSPWWTGLNIVGNATLAGKFSRQSRDLILSPWYSGFNPAFAFARDQNEKMNFANTKGGVKLSLPVGADTTGLDGHAVLIDDPNDASDQNDAALLDVSERFDLAWSSRLVNPSTGPIIVFQQRTHMKDLSGYLLDQAGWVWNHIVIRCEYEVGDPQKRPGDPRTEEGELAFPQRLDAAYIAQQKLKGAIFYEGQYQQRPVPRSGGTFDVDQILTVDELPERCHDALRARAWDFAYSEGHGDYTASAMGLMDWDDPAFEGALYICDVTEKQVKNPLSELRERLSTDRPDIHVRIPRDPGGGSRTADEAITMCAGRVVGDWRPTKEKTSTWLALASWVNAGRVRFLRGSWNQRMKDQMAMAPKGKHDDMLDAATELHGYLSKEGPGEAYIGYL